MVMCYSRLERPSEVGCGLCCSHDEVNRWTSWKKNLSFSLSMKGVTPIFVLV